MNWHDTQSETQPHTFIKAHTHNGAHTFWGGRGKGGGELGEMEDHLLAVQFILIQSGGRAEQRVNAAHIHILSTPWGCTHRHTLHTYTNTHTMLRKHTPLVCHRTTSWTWTMCSKCSFFDFYFVANKRKNLNKDWWIFTLSTIKRAVCHSMTGVVIGCSGLSDSFSHQ